MLAPLHPGIHNWGIGDPDPREYAQRGHSRPALAIRPNDAAERTLDLQYYIIHNDDIGLFLIDRLLAAADRGVRSAR
jgi:hypothetical protein